METASRTPVRLYFAGLLNTALVGVGLPADAVYGYLAGKFGDKAKRVVVVSNGPIERKIQSLGNCYNTIVTLHVYVLVLYSDRQNGWTESNAEDAIDAIETIIADTVINNQSVEGYWGNARYAEPTQIEVANIGGTPYRAELIKVRMEVRQ